MNPITYEDDDGFVEYDDPEYETEDGYVDYNIYELND